MTNGKLSITVANAGLGPALDVRISGVTEGGNSIRERVIPVVAPGERADISLAVVMDSGGPPGGTDQNTDQTMRLTGHFIDRRRTTRFPIMWMRPGGEWMESELGALPNGALPLAPSVPNR